MNPLHERYGPWAIVTGASSGIGWTFAEKLGNAGFNLVLVARRAELLKALQSGLQERYSIEVLPLSLDLSRDESVELLHHACGDRPIGLLVNNAGTGYPGLFGESDLQNEKALVRLNCIAPMELTHRFLPAMLSRRRGGVILVSSMMGFQGVPWMANYSATKGYLLNLGESLYHECKPQGVDVLVLAPGATETPGKYLHDIDYSKLPVHWMSADTVVSAALRSLGKKAFVIPGWRNHLISCLSGGLWTRGWVQWIMRRLGEQAVRQRKEPRSPEKPLK